MKVAVIQMNSGADKVRNVECALEYCHRAIARKATFIALPEVFNYRGRLSSAADVRRVAEKCGEESTARIISLAKKCRVTILAGSILERSPHKGKAYNTSVLIYPNGKTLTYRKQHLFKAQVRGKKIDESVLFLAGRRGRLARVGSFNVGLSICYDLRFPQLYGRYAAQGADVLTVPSSFTHLTGKAHWKPLLQARAIENLSYVLAPNQCGIDGKGVKTYGHSMIISPWGEVMNEADGRKEGVITAEISRQEIRKARKALPFITP